MNCFSPPASGGYLQLLPVSGRCCSRARRTDAIAEFSPEWQALQAARHIQAQTYFIDLPCWAQSEEEDDLPDTQEESQPCCCVPPAWITAIPCGITCSKMKPANCITLCTGALFCPTAGRFPRRCTQSSARSLYGSLDCMGSAAK